MSDYGVSVDWKNSEITIYSATNDFVWAGQVGFGLGQSLSKEDWDLVFTDDKPDHYVELDGYDFVEDIDTILNLVSEGPPEILPKDQEPFIGSSETED